MLGKFFKAEEEKPRIPSGHCVYAVGDIHGRIDLLHEMLERIWYDAPDCKKHLVFLGDYLDRGPSSNEVVEFLQGIEGAGWDFVMLRGNHEQLVLDYLDNFKLLQPWRTFGGAETLLSYGVQPPKMSSLDEFRRVHAEFKAALPPSHLAFLKGLRLSYTLGDYFFVHAGVRPSVPLDRQTPEDLLWIREDFLKSKQRWEKVVVHGHSPSDMPEIFANRIGIDTGAYATNFLTAAKLYGESCTFLTTGSAQRKTRR